MTDVRREPRRQISSVDAIAKLLERCYRFDAMDQMLAKRRARVARNANLLATHHLREALAAMKDCVSDCKMCKVFGHEHDEVVAESVV